MVKSLSADENGSSATKLPNGLCAPRTVKTRENAQRLSPCRVSDEKQIRVEIPNI